LETGLIFWRGYPRLARTEPPSSAPNPSNGAYDDPLDQAAADCPDACRAGCRRVGSAGQCRGRCHVEAGLCRIFQGSGGEGGDWDQPVWSTRTTRLIRQWKRHNGGELTGLSSYGWLCECQDWQWQKFAWQKSGIKQIAPGKLEVTVKVNPGFGDFLTQRLIMVREGKRWLIDDLFSESAPGGVRAAMQRELKEVPGS